MAVSGTNSRRAITNLSNGTNRHRHQAPGSRDSDGVDINDYLNDPQPSTRPPSARLPSTRLPHGRLPATQSGGHPKTSTSLAPISPKSSKIVKTVSPKLMEEIERIFAEMTPDQIKNAAIKCITDKVFGSRYRDMHYLDDSERMDKNNRDKLEEARKMQPGQLRDDAIKDVMARGDDLVNKCENARKRLADRDTIYPETKEYILSCLDGKKNHDDDSASTPDSVPASSSDIA